jgi:hypothetical protein
MVRRSSETNGLWESLEHFEGLLTLFAESTNGNTWLLAAHDEIGMMFRHFELMNLTIELYIHRTVVFSRFPVGWYLSNCKETQNNGVIAMVGPIAQQGTFVPRFPRYSTCTR